MQILCKKKINKCPPAALQHCCVLYIRRLFYKRGEDPLVSLFWCYTPRALMFLLYLLDVFASYSFTPEMDDNKQLLLKYVYTYITRLFLRYIIIIIRQSKVNKRTAYRIKRKDVGHFVIVDFFIFFWQVDDETLRHWLWLFLWFICISSYNEEKGRPRLVDEHYLFARWCERPLRSSW